MITFRYNFARIHVQMFHLLFLLHFLRRGFTCLAQNWGKKRTIEIHRNLKLLYVHFFCVCYTWLIISFSLFLNRSYTNHKYNLYYNYYRIIILSLKKNHYLITILSHIKHSTLWISLHFFLVISSCFILRSFSSKIYTISATYDIYYFKYEKIYYPGTYNFSSTFFSSIPLQCY